MLTEREEKILEVIGKKKLTFDEISQEVFKNNKDIPFDPTVTINNSVNRIIKKCERYKLSWTLVKDKVEGKKIVVHKVKK